MLAIRTGDVQTVTKLTTSVSCIQTHSAEEDWTALHEAANYGQAACVKALLKGKPMLWKFRIVQNVTIEMIKPVFLCFLDKAQGTKGSLRLQWNRDYCCNCF